MPVALIVQLHVPLTVKNPFISRDIIAYARACLHILGHAGTHSIFHLCFTAGLYGALDSSGPSSVARLHCKTRVYVCRFACGHIPHIYERIRKHFKLNWQDVLKLFKIY